MTRSGARSRLAVAAGAVRAMLQAAQVSRCKRNAEVIAILQAN